MIQHTVSFKLKHKSDSEQEKEFLENSKNILCAIPQVLDFKILKQVSNKCDYNFCFSMYFKNQENYETYNLCEIHKRYVEKIWINNVTDFQEQDFIEI